jgi:hypothetical protein
VDNRAERIRDEILMGCPYMILRLIGFYKFWYDKPIVILHCHWEEKIESGKTRLKERPMVINLILSV